ncbi:hypothetical protein JW978_01040 [Candidatus Dojkabacteria bacterium]|nr:hypothetical protein [Candidatus Dojkabacteria bacterium]
MPESNPKNYIELFEQRFDPDQKRILALDILNGWKSKELPSLMTESSSPQSVLYDNPDLSTALNYAAVYAREQYDPVLYDERFYFGYPFRGGILKVDFEEIRPEKGEDWTSRRRKIKTLHSYFSRRFSPRTFDAQRRIHPEHSRAVDPDEPGIDPDWIGSNFKFLSDAIHAAHQLLSFDWHKDVEGLPSMDVSDEE